MYQKFFLGFIITFILIFAAPTAYGADFPEWKENLVQVESANTIFSQDKIDDLEETLRSFSYPSKIIIFEALDEPLESYILDAFEHYELSDDSILLMFDMKSEDMAAVVGSKLTDIGITAQFLEDKKLSIFDNFARQNNYIYGLLYFITEIDEEIVNYELSLESTDHGSGMGSTSDLTDTDMNPSDADETTPRKNKASWFMWALLVLGFIVLLFLLGMWQRSKIIRRLDELEEYKEQVEEYWLHVDFKADSEPLQESLKLRQESLLTLKADYQERILPSLIEDFIETEYLADRLRIFTAWESVGFIEEILEEAARNLEQFFEEVKEIEAEKVELPNLIKRIGQDLTSVERKIHTICEKYGVSFQILKENLTTLAHEHSVVEARYESGEVFESNQLSDIQSKLAALVELLNKVDEYVIAIEEEIPTRLKKLDQKFKDVQEEGEVENHERLLGLLKESRANWNSLMTIWDEGRLTELATLIQNINDKLNEVDEALQDETTIRTELLQFFTSFEERLANINEAYEQDRSRFQSLVTRYQLEEDPALDLIEAIKQKRIELESTYQELITLSESYKYQAAWEKIDLTREQLEQLAIQVEKFHNRINTLSQEEEESKVTLKALRNRLLILRQRLDRTILPGRQDYLADLIEEGFDAILETEVLFDQIPLRLNKILHYLEQAIERVEEVERITDGVLTSVVETERIIRELNIYRYRIPQVGKLLMMAENHFRDCEFEEALELASKAESLITKKEAQ